MKTGDRVGAILKMDGKSVHFIGYGTLIERETPGPEAVGFNPAPDTVNSPEVHYLYPRMIPAAAGCAE